MKTVPTVVGGRGELTIASAILCPNGDGSRHLLLRHNEQSTRSSDIYSNYFTVERKLVSNDSGKSSTRLPGIRGGRDNTHRSRAD
jgi:hypothetical protein